MSDVKDLAFEEKFSIEDSDEDILSTIAHWVKESQTYHDALLKKQKMSEEYYLGNQTELWKVPSYLSNTVENRIFEAVETLVPIATATAHQFQVVPGSENEKSMAKADKLSKVLGRKYEVMEVQRKLEETTRNLLIYRFGVLKYEWSYEKDDVDVRQIDPRLIMIPKLRVDPHDSPYIIELQEYTRDELEKFFPDCDPDELSLGGVNNIDTGTTNEMKGTYQVLETWTNEMVVWTCNNTILHKQSNPYYDFKGEEKKKIEFIYDKKGKLKKKVTSNTKFYNHLDRPEKPFVFFYTYNVSAEPLPPVSLVEIAIPIQDSINVQKRAIINNLKQMGNGQVLADSDAITQEEAENLTNEPGLVIRGNGVASESKIKREAGVPIPNAHFSNLQHSEVTFDNLMGTHSATRGQAQAKTLGQDIISRQQDFTRIDMITRALNRGVSRLANGVTQLIKLFYTENHLIKTIGEEGAIEFLTLNRDDVEDYIEIIVKSGQNLPMDEVTLRTEAVQLWQLGAIAPITLFKRLKFPNPEKEEQNLLLYKQGQLSMETQAKIQEGTALAQAQAQAQAQFGGGEGAGASPSATKKAPARGVETPLNVLQRGAQGLGGTVPASPGVSKSIK